MSGRGNKKKNDKGKRNAKGTKRPSSQNASRQPLKASQIQRRPSNNALSRLQSTSQSNRPTTYRKHDTDTKEMRKGILTSCAERYKTHIAKRRADDHAGCADGFVQGLVDSCTAKAPGLNITRNDINNQLRSWKAAQKKADEEAKKNTRQGLPSDSSSNANAATSSSSTLRSTATETASLNILAAACLQELTRTRTADQRSTNAIEDVRQVAQPSLPRVASLSSSQSQAATSLQSQLDAVSSFRFAASSRVAASSQVAAASSSQVAASSVVASSRVDALSVAAVSSVAATSSGSTTQATSSSCIVPMLTIPNRCSFDGCGAPMHIEPDVCIDCKVGKALPVKLCNSEERYKYICKRNNSIDNSPLELHPLPVVDCCI